MGARAETDVFGKIPVFAVVPRAEAGQGKIRDLVVFKAVLTQDAAQGEIGVRLRIIVREDGSLAPHFRHGLELEAVAGKVGRLKRKTLRKRVEKHILRLTGQTVHQIQADVGKSVLVCEQNGTPCPREVVDAPDAAQLVIMRGLHAEGKPVCTAAPQRVEERRVRALRVALDRYFRVLCQSKALADRVKDAFEARAAQIRRRAAAEVDRIGRAACAFSPYSRMERMRALV